MTLHIPIRTPADRDPADDLLSDGCCQCCDFPAVGIYDGDVLCGPCADEWEAEQEALREIERVEEWAAQAMRSAGVSRGAEIEARLSDAALLAHSLAHRNFNRNERRAAHRVGGRS